MNEKEKNDLKEILKGIIDDIVVDAFSRINYAYQYHREGVINEDSAPKAGETKTRIVFPHFSNGDTRISEQELRFAFVEAFNASQAVMENNLFYSVETPTRLKYKDFSSDPHQDDNGRSGEFDMVIFNEKQERVCLIEFKANNADATEHKKDLLKLNEEGDGILTYFIEVLKSYTAGDEETKTIGSLKRKIKLNNKEGKTLIRCYALEGNRRSNNKKGEDISHLLE